MVNRKFRAAFWSLLASLCLTSLVVGTTGLIFSRSHVGNEVLRLASRPVRHDHVTESLRHVPPPRDAGVTLPDAETLESSMEPPAAIAAAPVTLLPVLPVHSGGGAVTEDGETVRSAPSLMPELTLVVPTPPAWAPEAAVGTAHIEERLTRIESQLSGLTDDISDRRVFDKDVRQLLQRIDEREALNRRATELKTTTVIEQPAGDTRKPQTPVITKVYRPEQISSFELQALIQPLLTVGIGRSKVAYPPQNTDSDLPLILGNGHRGMRPALIVQDHADVIEAIDHVMAQTDVSETPPSDGPRVEADAQRRRY